MGCSLCRPGAKHEDLRRFAFCSCKAWQRGLDLVRKQRLRTSNGRFWYLAEVRSASSYVKESRQQTASSVWQPLAQNGNSNIETSAENRVYQTLRVRMLRAVDDVISRAVLHDFTEVEYIDSLCDLSHNGKIVRDEQIGKSELQLQPLE